MHMHLGNLVEVIGVVGEAVAHDVVGDDGIDLDAGDVSAAVSYGAQHIDTTARADDGEIAVRTQHVGDRRCGRHQIAAIAVAPMMRVGIHQRSLRIGIDNDGAAHSLLIDFNARDRIPLRIERSLALHSLGINDVDEAIAEVRDR